MSITITTQHGAGRDTVTVRPGEIRFTSTRNYAGGVMHSVDGSVNLTPDAARKLAAELAPGDLFEKIVMLGGCLKQEIINDETFIAKVQDLLVPSRTPVKVADTPADDSYKPVYWFGILVKCARLLNLPTDEPIPSGVLRAVEKLTAPCAAGCQMSTTGDPQNDCGSCMLDTPATPAVATGAAAPDTERAPSGDTIEFPPLPKAKQKGWIYTATAGNAAPGDLPRGFFMRHKGGGDVGFSWREDDPKFSDEWERIPAVPAAPAGVVVPRELLERLLAEPTCPSEVDGGPRCMSCGADIELDTHADDCPVVALRALLGA